MNTQSLVKAALKEKNPALFSSLQHSGKLNEFLDERTDEIKTAVHNRQLQIAKSQGMTESAPYLERVGILKMADALAREEVFAEMLEFPRDETSPSRPDEITPLVTPT